MKFKKTHDIDQISISLEGNQVVIGGWVEDLRKLGKMSFLAVRDVTGLAQVIVKDIALPEDLTRQTVITAIPLFRRPLATGGGRRSRGPLPISRIRGVGADQ